MGDAVTHRWNPVHCIYIVCVCVWARYLTQVKVFACLWQTFVCTYMHNCLLIVLLCMLAPRARCSFWLFSGSLISTRGGDGREAGFCWLFARCTGGSAAHAAHSGRLACWCVCVCVCVCLCVCIFCGMFFYGKRGGRGAQAEMGKERTFSWW